MAEQMEELTLEEYLQQEERYLQEQEESWKRKHVERAKTLLMAPPYSWSVKEAKETAEEVLDGLEIQCNAVDDDESDLLTENTNDFNKLQYSVAVLLIRAPKGTSDLTYEDDVKSRELQYKNFVKLHPYLQRENAKVFKMDLEVLEYEEMQNYIEEFLRKNGSKSVLSSIFVNGHGSKEGLCLHKETVDIPLDTVLDDICHIFEATRSDLDLPDKLEIVFGQCHAHLHEPCNYERVAVHKFTSHGHERTFVKLKRDDLTRDVIDAKHRELNNHAEEPHPEWDQAEKTLEEVHSTKPQADPSTSLGSTEPAAEDKNELKACAQREQPAHGEAGKRMPSESTEDAPSTGVVGQETDYTDEIKGMEDRVQSLEIE